MLRYVLFVTAVVASLASRPADAQEPSRLSLDEAIERALAKNPEIAVQRDNVALADEAGRRAEGAYDLQLRFDGRVRTRTDPANTIFVGAPEGALAPRNNSTSAAVGFSRLFSTGAVASATTAVSVDDTNGLYYLLSPSYPTSFGVDVRQPLVQGRRIDAPRRALRIAAVDRERSAFALRRTLSETVAAIERAYWTLAAAGRDVDVRRRAVELAEQQREDTVVRLEAGTAAESELAQPEAEIERRKGELYAAQEAAQRAAVALKSLMLGTADDPLWDAELLPSDAPRDVSPPPGVRDALLRALSDRPEVGEAMQLMARQDVEIEAARDRLRPAVDLVGSYNLRGLAGSRNASLQPPFEATVVLPEGLQGSLGQSYLNLLEHRFLDASVGVTVSVPIGNRVAQAELASAEIGRHQAVLTLDQVKQRIAAEVRNAVVALRTAAQRVEAARAGRTAAQVQLQSERDRFDAGLTNNFFVLTRQNDLAQAEVTEITALADYQKALTEYARAAGTLLADRQIHVETATAGDHR